MPGIVSYGAYVPARRLQRLAVFSAVGWYSPAIMMMAMGERSLCNWDEDALSMSVEAARNCLRGLDKRRVDGVYLAGTTLPYADRQNAGIVAAALNLSSELAAVDFTGSQKAGISALIAGLQAVSSGERQSVLIAAGDRRPTRAGSFTELYFGDGAGALLLGEDPIAEYAGSYALAHDFVDHYRGADARYDYGWEERWVRDEGYAKIIPQAIAGLLKKLGWSAGEVAAFAYPCYFTGAHKAIAKKLGLQPGQAIDNFHNNLGETGCAHPLLQLIAALEKANPGDKVIVAGFGQGCDAAAFTVTERIAAAQARPGLSAALAHRVVEENYQKALAFTERIEVESGIRAEAPTQTALTVLWRKRKMLLGLVGGKCKACGTPQYPAQDICVNPACNAFHQLEDYEFAERPAVIKAFTGDLLAVTIEPPAVYGLVQFAGGGRMVADFTDCELHKLKVGQSMRMVFRKRYHDAERGFTGYFWKATPTGETAKGGA
ncbi:MAG TPA: 3-oxoacyl-[acyl-carrier-protein] synthase III C-terminal domain-containing protein [bacterium]|nr:3-oxoacyl-[acyl-carrier-protein] synthase III C-terminal domain-containing protein [bacterium]